jgi:hypothetical protein
MEDEVFSGVLQWCLLLINVMCLPFTTTAPTLLPAHKGNVAYFFAVMAFSILERAVGRTVLSSTPGALLFLRATSALVSLPAFVLRF